MTNILFIAYQFPPLNVGGTQRPLKFVKYLHEFGITPIIITLAQKSYKEVYGTFHSDIETMAEIPEGTTIIEIPSTPLLSKRTGEIKHFLEIYFSTVRREAQSWKPNLLARLPGIIEKYKPKAVFVTAPPFSMLPLAVEIAEKYKLPLISDLRDAWSQWNTTPYATKVHYNAVVKLEDEIFQKSKAIIATSKQTIFDFIKTHPNIQKSKFHYIPNGFDSEINKFNIKYDFSIKKEIVIGYTGSFYYSPESRQQMLTPWYKKRLHRKLQYTPVKEDWLYRSPYFFFKTLNKLFDKKPKLKSKVKIKFAGKKPVWIQAMIDEFKLSNNCDFVGQLNHKASLQFQKSCDALLITSSKVMGGKDYSIAGKTFEYIVAQKPILAFVTESAQKDVLEETGITIVCDPDDSEGAVNMLKSIFEESISLKLNKKFIEKHQRSFLTKKLSEILFSVMPKE